DEIVDRLRAAAFNGVADRFGRIRLRLGGAFARFSFAEGRFASALGREDRALLLALGTENRGLTGAFGFEDHSAFLAFGLHLPGHRVDDILGRTDVLELDP